MKVRQLAMTSQHPTCWLLSPSSGMRRGWHSHSWVLSGTWPKLGPLGRSFLTVPS